MLKLKVGPYKSCDPQNNIGRGEGRGEAGKGGGGGGGMNSYVMVFEGLFRTKKKCEHSLSMS